MILILSKSRFETTTDKVMDWLDSLGADFFRLNGKDFADRLNIVNGEIKNLDFDLSDVSVIWNRRWSNQSFLLRDRREDFSALGPENIMNLISNLWKERRTVTSYLLKHLREKEWTTRPHKMSVNKIEMLELAREAGLQVPAYIITSSLAELKNFAGEHEHLITKPVSDVTAFFDPAEKEDEEAELGKILTAKVNVADLEEKDMNTFHFSFFQEYIKKEYEIRTFYLYGKTYSMVIFSQNDSQTSVDFRNYNDERPNRCVPFQLPAETEAKIIDLMNSAELNIGSIDLIKKVGGGFYFLEVNPVGQFGMVSYPCNYYLEKKLAKHLTDEDQKEDR
jgi:ATP-GRASP peptide maturase of grasp-with-spasm system